jgi:DNA-binding CsgD family transcriptional regulator
MAIEMANPPRTARGDDPAARRRRAAELERRVAELVAALPEAALPRWQPSAPGDTTGLAEHLAGLCEAVRDRVRADGGGFTGAQWRRHHEVLDALQELRRAQVEQQARRRLLALAEVPELLAAAPGEGDVGRLLQRAAEQAARICDLDRVMIFRLDHAQLVPEVTYFVGHADWAAQVLERARPIELSAVRYEMELIRRRTAALVTAPLQDPRVTGPTIAELGTDGFVTVPVVVGGAVVATMAADTYFSGRRLDAADRDCLAVFAKGLGQALERSSLLERLAAQRDAVRRLVRATEATVAELATGEPALGPAPGGDGDLIAAPAPTAGSARGGTAPTPLTRREHEVLTLMARGATNREIAHRLVITEGTVKSHVKHVFRKLGVTNRAQAVSRHLGAIAAI